MPFDAILDQSPALQIVERALASGRVHHAYRFEGPNGVGKERLALAFAQALVCQSEGPFACEKCGPCHRAVTLSADEPRVPLHPDVILVGRGVYPQSIIGAAEATGISIEQIRRVVQSRAGFPPHEGRALVFIVRAAHELTPSAANALLKTLEEPAPRTHFVLLTDQPGKLLDTIRSRTLCVRFGPLSEATLERILEQHGAPRALAALAEGSAARALALADPALLEERDAFARAALAATVSPDLASGLKLFESKGENREGLRDKLVFLAQHLAGRARQEVGSDPASAERHARRHVVVQGALTELEQNVQPAFVLEAMITRLRRV